MKLLQNNFTSPEQSRRLLELGLPADSADCVIATYQDVIKHGILCYHYSSYGEFVEKVGNIAALAAIHPNEKYIPCWSVGRLIEIELMCREKRAGQIARLYFTAEDNPIDADTIGQSNITESLIRYMESALYNYDFSKLEK